MTHPATRPPAELRSKHSTRYQAALGAAQAAALEYLGGLGARPAAAATPPATVPPPPEGIGLQAALQHFREHYEPHLSAAPGPRYFGFVTGGSTPAALAGDWLSSAYDQNVSNDVGSVAAALERSTAAALGQLFGLPSALEGHFVSGATQSNLVALATARQWALQRLDYDVAEQGLAGAPRPRVLGGMPHSSILKAMAILGMGRRSLERVACRPGRTVVEVSALKRALEADDGRPSIVVASAGEVNTGDFDDLAAIAELCQRHGAWLHVDGAFGLFAALSPAHQSRLQGIEFADSVTVDLHKWLNVPYDSALIYTRHPALQRQTFSAAAAYLGDTPDPLHHVPENSRRFRALPAWFVLAAEGRRGVAEVVQRNCRLAEELGRRLAALPQLELLDTVRLNIVCFALRDPDPAARDAFLLRLQRDGRCFMTPTQLFGRPGVRAALSNWTTDEADVETTVAAVRWALES